MNTTTASHPLDSFLALVVADRSLPDAGADAAALVEAQTSPDDVDLHEDTRSNDPSLRRRGRDAAVPRVPAAEEDAETPADGLPGGITVHSTGRPGPLTGSPQRSRLNRTRQADNPEHGGILRGAPWCRHCHHPAHRADCGVDDCGCVRYEAVDRAAREARKRTWLVDVSFFVRNRWVDAPQQRVKAAGHGGALMRGVRAAKQAALRPRQRVAQVRVLVAPVPRSGQAR